MKMLSIKIKLLIKMNLKLINQENKIKELNEKIVTLTNDYNNSKGEIINLIIYLLNKMIS